MPHDETCDRIELQDLILTYAAAVDERDRQRYLACFAEDVEVFNFGTGTYRGRDSWVEYVWSALQKYSASQHLLGPQLATIDGDHARTRCDFQALHVLADDSSRVILWGTYHTDMHRSDGRWLISRHELQVRATSTD